MIKGKKILAVVPARGGSKGVPLKNLKEVRGVPIVARVGHLLKKFPEIDRKIVSSDHPKILDVAKESGLDVPFTRPEELSGDRISDLQVLTHAINEMEEQDQCRYDVIVLLPPTSPLRTEQNVRDVINKLIDGGFDTVMTISESDSKYHPMKALTYDPEGTDQIGYYDPRGHEIIARQQLGKLYHRNGACFAFTRECLMEQRKIIGDRSSAVLTEYMVSIDTLWDFKQVEVILEEREASSSASSP